MDGVNQVPISHLKKGEVNLGVSEKRAKNT